MGENTLLYVALFGVGIVIVNIISSYNNSIQPSIQRIVVILAIAWCDDQLSNSITNIALIAIVFHLVWGALFGFSSSLLRIRVYKIKQHYKDIMNIDPNTRFITIFDANGNILYTRHHQGVQNLLNEDENKKSLEMAMNSWKVREGL